MKVGINEKFVKEKKDLLSKRETRTKKVTKEELLKDKQYLAWLKERIAFGHKYDQRHGRNR